MTEEAMLWTLYWRLIAPKGDGLSCQRDVLARYAEPQRCYHTRQHLDECLAWFRQNPALTRARAVLFFALYYHDAVYQPFAENNEAASAQLAVQQLKAHGVELATCMQIQQLILATQHHGYFQVKDELTAELLDIDLAILAAPTARFTQYEAQIRQEYAEVPDLIFKHKRGAMLKGFLARPYIYLTVAFQQRFEKAARENLQRACLNLSK